MIIELTDREAGAIAVILEGVGYDQPSVVGTLASLVAKNIDPRLYLAIAVIKLGYRAFKNNLTDSALTCKKFRGFKRQLCISNYEIMVLEDRVWKMKQVMMYDPTDILGKKIELIEKKITIKKADQALMIKKYMEGKV